MNLLAVRSCRLAGAMPGVLLLAAALLASGCGPRQSERGGEGSPQVYRGEMRFGLSFEERMAIPPEVSRLRAEAQRRAAEVVYDPFGSEQQAIRNEEYTRVLVDKAIENLLDDYELTREELEAINREYQYSLGANIR